ncbi:uncharacterized protein LOC114841392 [Diachasma alloeum]|uniref:Gustatory receptor n=1 Tax=Diachasma alloeum TaxID=454923 RepID=A0A4E0RMX8_9HYME|nr:uncharacterized protein LOC114841392 [Diachasma alloeum]THK33128.1 gustatory receptor 23 [Diachasma alloeum]
MNKREKKFYFCLIILSNCFGLFEFGVKRIKLRGRGTELRLQKSRLARVWSLILIGIILYTNYLIPILDCWMYTQDKWMMFDYAKSFQTILGSLIVIVLWIYCFLKQNSLIKMANKFIEIDNFFEKYRHIFQLTGFKDVIPFTVIFIIMSIAEVVMENAAYGYYGKYLWYIWWYKYLFPHFVLMTFILQYATVIRSMRIRMESLNRGLAKLTSSSHDFQNKFTVAGRMFTNEMMLESFDSIRNLYEELYKLSVEISEFYSFPILLVMAYVTFLIVTLAYCLVTMVMHFYSSELIVRILPGLSFSLLTSLSGRLIHEIEGLVKEFKKIAPTAFELLHSFPGDHALTTSVICFTQELLHKDLVFTAYGLFPLNSTLFQSIFSSALTYSIIILQTQGSGRAVATGSNNQTH